MIVVKNPVAKTIEEINENVKDMARQALNRDVIKDVEEVTGTASAVWSQAEADMFNSLVSNFNQLVRNIRA